MSNNDKINAENTNNTPLGNFHNFQDFKKINHKTKSKHIVIVISISVILFGALFFYLGFYNQADDSKDIISEDNSKIEKYHIGQLGDDHAHAVIIISINENSIDFAQEQFQLKSKYIHFENNNSYLIHRHATGVPLEVLFDSIGMEITKKCIIISEKSYCDSELKSFVNEKPYPDIAGYILKHNDKILISLGDSNNFIQKNLDKLESLQIYDIPKPVPKLDNEITI